MHVTCLTSAKSITTLLEITKGAAMLHAVQAAWAGQGRVEHKALGISTLLAVESMFHITQV